MTELPTEVDITRLIVGTSVGRIYILYGSDPSSRQPFRAAAMYLHERLSSIYKNTKVITNEPQNIAASGKLMQLLLESRTAEEEKIRELHIFSHSWSSGLSLSYGEDPLESDIDDLAKVYGDLVRECIGDDDLNQFHPTQFRIANLEYLSEEQIVKLRNSFVPSGAVVRFWGCNSGVDDSPDNPYSNIAKTFAQYANVTTYGSSGPTQFYAFIDGKWTTEFGVVRETASWPFELRVFRSRKNQQSNEFKPSLSLNDLLKKKVARREMHPMIEYLDYNLDAIPPDSSNPELFKLKAGAGAIILLSDFGNSDKKLTLSDLADNKLPFDKIMTVTPHTEWKLSDDKLQLRLIHSRGNFTAEVRSQLELSKEGLDKGEYYFVISYHDIEGDKVFEGKKCRFGIA